MKIAFGGWAGRDARPYPQAVAYELKGAFYVVASGSDERVPVEDVADGFAAALAGYDHSHPRAQRVEQLMRGVDDWLRRRRNGARIQALVADVEPERASICRVGQTCALLLRAGQLRQLVDEDTRPASVTALGAAEPPQLDVVAVDLEPGDVLVLLSHSGLQRGLALEGVRDRVQRVNAGESLAQVARGLWRDCRDALRADDADDHARVVSEFERRAAVGLVHVRPAFTQ